MWNILVIVSPAFGLSVPLPSWISFFVTPILSDLRMLVVVTVDGEGQILSMRTGKKTVNISSKYFDKVEESLAQFCGTKLTSTSPFRES